MMEKMKMVNLFHINRKILFILFVSIAQTNIYGQKIDTLFYDQNGRGVETKIFATYIRYASYTKDDNFINRFWDYYVTGEIRADGEVTYIEYNKNGNISHSVISSPESSSSQVNHPGRSIERLEWFSRTT